MTWQPGQSGNPTGGAKAKQFLSSLNRAIVQEDGKRLRAAAEQLLDQAAAGEQWAIKELADRLDGKAAQAITGDSENPLTLIQRIELAALKNDNSQD